MKKLTYTTGISGGMLIAFFCLVAGASAATPVGTITFEDFTTTPGTVTQLHTSTTPVDFDFNGYGVRLTGDNLSPDVVQVQATLTQADGTELVAIHPLGDDAKGPGTDQNWVSAVEMTSGTTSIALNIMLADYGTEQPRVDAAEVVYFDTTVTGGLQFAVTAAATATDGPVIVSRAGWEADESLGLSDGDPIWPVEYEDVAAFIVHHTAGSDGGSDPAATVRATHFYHTSVLGWGDIGYNFLIDQDGTIYEGRAGGDGAIGGHTFNSLTNTNYNPGTMGIALIGCFEDTSGACDETHSMTDAMQNAVAELIGAKAAFWELDPEGTTTVAGNVLDIVSGHRDLDATYCPGNLVHDDIATIRSLASTYAAAYGTPALRGNHKKTKVYALGTTEEAVTADADNTLHSPRKKLSTHEDYQIRVRYKNTGSSTWTQEDLRLKIYNKTGKNATSLAHDSWPNSLGGIQMLEDSVAPGERATFVVPLTTPTTAKRRTIVTKLFNAGSKVKKTNDTRKLVFRRHISGEAGNNTVPLALFAGDTIQADFTFTNTSDVTWKRGVYLTIDGEEVYRFSKSTAVKPGETITITAPFTAQTTIGTQYAVAKLKQGPGINVPGTHSVITVRIDPAP